MDPAIIGGTTYHGWDYKVVSGILTWIAISPNSLSREWISFKLVHKVQQVGVYIGSPPGGANCHRPYLRFYGHLKFLSHTLRQTLFLPKYFGDLT